MDKNKRKMLMKLKLHKNELVLLMFNVVRLLDFYEDDEDYYYKIYELDRGIVYSSGVIDIIPLKGFISDEKYRWLDRIFKYQEEQQEVN